MPRTEPPSPDPKSSRLPAEPAPPAGALPPGAVKVTCVGQNTGETTFDCPARAACAPRCTALITILLGVEILLFATLLGLYPVLRETQPELFAPSQRPATLPFGLLQLVVILLAAGSAVLAGLCVKRRRHIEAMCFLAATLMYGLVFIGAVTTGRLGNYDVAATVAHAQYIATATAPASDPVPLAAVVQDTPAQPTRDVQRGSSLFLASCAGCHGPAAEGSAAAPPLRDTPFMQRGDQIIFAVAVEGRQANDPESLTGRAMPPRGGNLFLTDDEVRDIIAYLRELAAGSDDGDTTPMPDVEQMVPRWVVAVPPAGAPGLAPALLEMRSPEVNGLPAAPEDSPSALMKLYLMFVTLQAFHLGVGMFIVARLLVYVHEHGEASAPLCRMAHVYWLSAAAAWGVVFSLMYLLP